jgi:beta-1,4-N-acetylglucosaminyltransferase
LIFVTIGTQRSFDRLVMKMDEIAGTIDEEVLIQTGNSKYVPRRARHFTFLDRGEIRKYNQLARVVITHAGVGSIIDALEHKKPLIIVPRRKEYGEIADDHQLQISGVLALNNNIKVAYEMDDIVTYIPQNYNYMFQRDKEALIRSLKQYIDTVAAQGR